MMKSMKDKRARRPERILKNGATELNEKRQLETDKSIYFSLT